MILGIRIDPLMPVPEPLPKPWAANRPMPLLYSIHEGCAIGLATPAAMNCPGLGTDEIAVLAGASGVYAPAIRRAQHRFQPSTVRGTTFVMASYRVSQSQQA